MEYIKKGGTLPPPFNVVLIPKSVQDNVYKPLMRILRREKKLDENLNDSTQVDSNNHAKNQHKKVISN
jgi:hypothetical protein